MHARSSGTLFPGQRARIASLCAIVVVVVVALGARAFAARAGDSGATSAPCDEGDTCPFVPSEPAASLEPASAAALEPVTLVFFWGVGCPHCEEAKPYLEQLARDRPSLIVEAIEVRADPAGRRRFVETLQRLGSTAAGIPTFVLGERHVVGFTRGVSERAIVELLDGVTPHSTASSGGATPSDLAPSEVTSSGEVATKWFGRVSVGELGLPLFTLILGLLDGFNPCAMWVLIFLLAMLAGQRDRARMAATAATFVVTSGVVYFALMAAWLSVFSLLGMTRAMQLALGGVALVIGGVNVKDFFAFKRGVSLSIPEGSRPGIYARVRAILHEHSLAGSLFGVAVLAVLVNFIELLCTAGLPAIYTAILSRQELSTTARLGYLVLYNVAYVADDALMVTLAVATLSRRRLSEAAGRWLKLLSGAVMFGLGALLIFQPGWLP